MCFQTVTLSFKVFPKVLFQPTDHMMESKLSHKRIKVTFKLNTPVVKNKTVSWLARNLFTKTFEVSYWVYVATT